MIAVIISTQLVRGLQRSTHLRGGLIDLQASLVSFNHHYSRSREKYYDQDIIAMESTKSKHERCFTALYRSLPLNHVHDTIRVLDLRPGSQRAQIIAGLRIVRLAQNPYYEALSYTWGGVPSGKHIIVNNLDLPVTDNLFAALSRLRTLWKKRTLWVDQLCINQADNDERRRQVALMGKIYSDATSVNAWVGEPTVHPGLDVTKFGSNMKLLPYLIDPRLMSLKDMTRVVPKHLRSSADSLDKPRALVNSALSNTEPRWPDRSWVVQEFVLAKKAYICCGSKRWLFSATWLDDQTLGRTAEKVQHWSSGEQPDLETPHWQSFCSMVGSLNRYKDCKQPDRWTKDAEPPSDGKGGIIDVLSHLGTADATEPKDHVFSILGIIEEREASLITIDYNSSCAEIYAQATYASMQARNDADILAFVVPSRVTHNLPSWSVDFAVKHLEQYWNGIENRKWSHMEKCVLKKKLGIANLDPVYERSQGTLTISGTMLDTIVDILPISRIWESGNRTWEYVPEQLEDFVSCAIAAIRAGRGNRRMRTFMEKTDLIPPMAQVSPHSRSMATLKHNHLGAFYFWRLHLDGEGLLGDADTGTHHGRSEEEYLENTISNTQSYLELTAGGLSICATSAGVVALVPPYVRRGDALVFVRSHSPFLILRPVNKSEYAFLAHPYVYPWGVASTECLERTLETLTLDHDRIVLR